MVDFKTCPDCGTEIGISRETCSCGYSFRTGVRTKAWKDRHRRHKEREAWKQRARQEAASDEPAVARRSARRSSGGAWPIILAIVAIGVGAYSWATAPTMSALAALVAVSGFLIARRVDSLSVDVAMLQAEVARLRDGVGEDE